MAAQADRNEFERVQRPGSAGRLMMQGIRGNSDLDNFDHDDFNIHKSEERRRNQTTAALQVEFSNHLNH